MFSFEKAPAPFSSGGTSAPKKDDKAFIAAKRAQPFSSAQLPKFLFKRTHRLTSALGYVF
jgi:hypothetical protein